MQPSLNLLSCFELGQRLLLNAEISGEDLVWTRYGQAYGKIRVPGTKSDTYVHRVAYVLYHGSIPDGMTIDHVLANGCRDTRCFRLEHLEAVTTQENNARRLRADACPRGHTFTDDNVYWINSNKNGKPYRSRRCRTCVLEKMQERYRRIKAEQPPAPKPEKTHCIHGHELVPGNIYWVGGYRRCKTCVLAGMKKQRDKKRALDLL